MGRNAKPTELLLLEGKTHLTKAQLEKRKAQEIKLKNQTIRADPMVMADKRALKEFKNLRKLYAEIDFVGTLDSHIINQYCLSVAELDDLVMVLTGVREMMRSEDPAAKAAAIKNYLSIDTELRLKRTEIMKLSDRLYLNPVSRTKNLPKREKPARDPKASMFGDEKSG